MDDIYYYILYNGMVLDGRDDGWMDGWIIGWKLECIVGRAGETVNLQDYLVSE